MLKERRKKVLVALSNRGIPEIFYAQSAFRHIGQKFSLPENMSFPQHNSMNCQALNLLFAFHSSGNALKFGRSERYWKMDSFRGENCAPHNAVLEIDGKRQRPEKNAVYLLRTSGSGIQDGKK